MDFPKYDEEPHNPSHPLIANHLRDPVIFHWKQHHPTGNYSWIEFMGQVKIPDKVHHPRQIKLSSLQHL